MLNKETKKLIKLVRERMKFYFEKVNDDRIKYRLYRKLYTKYAIEGMIPYDIMFIDNLIYHDYHENIDVVYEDDYCIPFLNECYKNNKKYYYGAVCNEDDKIHYFIEILVKKDNDYLARGLFETLLDN